jgi:transaldolase
VLAEGKEMFSWIPNAYIKYPRIHEGLRAAQMSVKQGMRVNMTLCFSQEQAAAVYAATKGAKEPVYVSPFVGMLDDRGDDGMGVIVNIKKMYQSGDGHVQVVAASFRKLEYLLHSMALGAELATSPAKILEEWATAGFPLPDQNFRYQAENKAGHALRPIPYKQLDLNVPWELRSET